MDDWQRLGLALVGGYLVYAVTVVLRRLDEIAALLREVTSLKRDGR